MKNKNKITLEKLMILIISKYIDEGKINREDNSFHYTIFSPIIKAYKDDSRLNFNINESEVPGHKRWIECEKRIESTLSLSSPKWKGDNWSFKKKNPGERDGIYTFNLDCYNPNYSTFFKNKKITLRRLMILIISKYIDEGKITEEENSFHYKIFSPILLSLKNDGRLNFTVNENDVKNHHGYKKYESAIRCVLNLNCPKIKGENWIFKKTNPDKKDGLFSFNFKFYDETYDDFFESSLNSNDWNEVSENINIEIEIPSEEDNQVTDELNINLKETWERKCSFCNLDVPQLIESAYVNEFETELLQSENNIIPLCRNCHKLFDSNRLFIEYENNKFNIKFSSNIKSKFADLINKEVFLPKSVDKDKFIKNLEIRNENY